MKKFNSKGITLVSLVVAIVILIILAGVTISNIIGNQSSINRAEQAKLTEEQESKKEVLEQALIKYNSGDYIGDGNFKSFLTSEFKDLKLENIVQFTDLNGKISYVIHDFMGENVYITSEDDLFKVESFSNLGYLEKLEDGDILISPKSKEEFDIKENSDNNKYAIIESSNDLKDISFNIPANTEVSIKLLSDMTITNEGLDRAAINLNSNSILNLEIYGNVEVTSKYGKDPEQANGKPGKPGSGGFAGIHVPKDATLNLYGTGTIIAKGGDAGDGSDAAQGDIGGSGRWRSWSWNWRKWWNWWHRWNYGSR